MITFAGLILMQKKFVGSLFLLLLVNVLVKPFWIFGIDLEVQNRVGGEAYGYYAAVLSFSMIINIVLDLGLAHYSNRSISRKPAEVASHFSDLILLKLVLAFVYLLFAFVAGSWLGYLGDQWMVLLYLAIGQALSSLILFFRAHLAGLHLFKYDSLMSIVDKLLMIIMAGYVLYFNDAFLMTIERFALLQTLSYGLAALLGFVLIYPRVKGVFPKLKWKGFLVRLKGSAPYALLIFLMALYTRVDSVMLQQLVGDLENGIYAQAFRLLDAINQPAYLFSVILLPLFSGLLARGDSVTALSKLAFSLLYVLCLTILLGVYFAAPGLMDLLYLDHSASSAPVLQVLLFSSLAFGTTFVFGTLLTAKGDLNLLNKVAFIGFVLNIVLNLILIPRYGAIGAAFATVVTQSSAALVQMFLCFKKVNLHYGARFWLRLFSFSLVAIVLSIFLQNHLLVVWWQKSLLVASLIAIIALLSGLLPLKDAYRLIKPNQK
jgi:O-antigen/teichoic acid export membrane protein